jgi:hypothetical protein
MSASSFFLPLIVQSVLVPFAVTLAALAAARALRMTAPLMPAALALGFVAAYFAAFHAQWSPLPHQALDWLPWLAAFGCVAASAIGQIRDGRARRAARAALALLAAGTVVWPALAGIGPYKALAVMVATASWIAAAWSLLARSAERGPTPPVILAVLAGGAALTLALDSSQALGQSSGALAAALAAVIAFNLACRGAGFSGASAGTAVLLAGVLLADGYLYASLPIGYVLLLAGGVLVERFGVLRRGRHGLASWPAAALLTAIPVLTTVALAFRSMQDAGGY